MIGKVQENGSDFTSTTSAWSRLKDPRIVRVSRATAGKDRHSKVCTVRGLRDRRVRLSVPTAIQLYDLQERLGLTQPSKVVDWLLNVAKHDIDGLPPLQIPQGFSFGEKPLLEQGHEFSLQNPSSFATLMSSNLSLSQTPISLALAAHQHQDFAYQTGPYFVPQIDMKHHIAEVSSSSKVRPSDFNMNV